jgi:hypothetical protein
VKSGLLDAATLGIYGTYWFYAVNKELAALGRARGTDELGTNPTNSLLALLPGILLLLIPFLISGNNTAKRVRTAQRLSGAGETIDTAKATAAMIPFPIAVYYVQKELNRVWAAENA